MDVLVIEPGKDPEVRSISKDLKSLQAVVGGHLETLTLPNRTVMVLNEEGKMNGLPFNRFLSRNGIDVDKLVGTIFICGVKGEDFGSLSKAEIDSLLKCIDKKRFTMPEPVIRHKRRDRS
jgi:hypothetical protein